MDARKIVTCDCPGVTYIGQGDEDTPGALIVARPRSHQRLLSAEAEAARLAAGRRYRPGVWCGAPDRAAGERGEWDGAGGSRAKSAHGLPVRAIGAARIVAALAPRVRRLGGVISMRGERVEPDRG